MTTKAINVEGLSKIFRIGVRERKSETFLGAIANGLKAPIYNLRRLRGLTRFQDEELGADDVIWALRDVNFSVEAGEVVGIIGANGAGKSTLLKILAGITEPSSGRAVIRGRIGSLLEVGTGMHPELTGRENIYLSGTMLGMKKAEIDRKFDEIIDFAEVERFIDTPVKRYSSGMKVRLGFAIAAHLEPEILLVDEVLAVGDAAFQKKCLGKMGTVARRGRTVVFVSHNLASVVGLCNRSLLLQDGKCVAEGASHDMVRQYLTCESRKHGDSTEAFSSQRNASVEGLQGWVILDTDYGLGRRVGFGNEVRFRLPYRIHHAERVRWVSLCLVIKDTLGRPLMAGATSFLGASLVDVPKVGTFECSFDCLPLTPGVYHLHLWYEDSTGETLRITNAGSFEVCPGSRPAFPHWPSVERHGPVLVPHKWTVLDAPPQKDSYAG